MVVGLHDTGLWVSDLTTGRADHSNRRPLLEVSLGVKRIVSKSKDESCFDLSTIVVNYSCLSVR